MEENINENVDRIFYKVEVGRTYIVFASEYNGKIQYRIPIEQKNLDGTKTRAYMTVRFKKDVVLDNATKIKIKQGFENFWLEPTDPKGYKPRMYIQINDFEIVENPTVQNQINDYNQDVSNDDDDLPF